MRPAPPPIPPLPPELVRMIDAFVRKGDRRIDALRALVAAGERFRRVFTALLQGAAVDDLLDEQGGGIVTAAHILDLWQEQLDAVEATAAAGAPHRN
jgi:hypothetical protein